MRKALFTAVLLVMCVVLIPASGFCLVSTTVPLDDPVYREIDKLAGWGLIEDDLGSMRPLTRMQVGRLLAEAQANLEAGSDAEKRVTGSAAGLLGRWIQRYEEEIAAARGERPLESTSVTPVAEFSLAYAYLDGPFATYNDEGVDRFDGHNAVGELRSRARLWHHLAFYVNPLFLYNQNAANVSGDDETDLFLQKAYGILGFGNFAVEVGRDALWWGPGYNGALLMSGNAQPLDMIKLSNPRPARLPWILRYLGPVQFNLVLSELGDDRPIAKPYLYGLRFDLKPHPLVEIGLSQIAIFGGEGRRDLSLGDYLKILYGNENRDGTKLDSNQQFAVDLALRIPGIYKVLPLAHAAKVYGEVGAEDTGMLPDRRAFLVGARLYGLFMVENLVATVEYVDTSPSSVPRAWYRHNWYPATYEGDVFGHHAGTDAEDLYCALAYDFSERLWARLSFEHESRGVSLANPEVRYRGLLDMEYALTPHQTVCARYGYEKVYDVDNLDGVDRDDQLVEVRVRFYF